MHYDFNIKNIAIGLYDSELKAALFPRNQLGSYISRESVKQIHHSSQSFVEHPEIPWVVENTNGHIYLSGKFEFEWGIEISHNEMQQYIDLLEDDFIGTGITYSFFKGDNKLTMTMDTNGFKSPEWSDKPMRWIPASSSAKVTFQSDDSEAICVTRINDSYSKWSFDQKTVEPNSSAIIERPSANVCYIITSDDIGPLLGKKMYKLTSDSISVSGSNKRVRIMRYYK